MKLTRIKAGEKFVVREGAYNAFCDAAEANAANAGASGRSGTAAGGNGPALIVSIINETGHQLDAGYGCWLDELESSAPLTQSRYDANARPMMRAAFRTFVSTARWNQLFGVLLESIPAGSIGRVCIAGVCAAYITESNATAGGPSGQGNYAVPVLLPTHPTDATSSDFKRDRCVLGRVQSIGPVEILHALGDEDEAETVGNDALYLVRIDQSLPYTYRAAMKDDEFGISSLMTGQSYPYINAAAYPDTLSEHLRGSIATYFPDAGMSPNLYDGFAQQWTITTASGGPVIPSGEEIVLNSILRLPCDGLYDVDLSLLGRAYPLATGTGSSAIVIPSGGGSGLTFAIGANVVRYAVQVVPIDETGAEETDSDYFRMTWPGTPGFGSGPLHFTGFNYSNSSAFGGVFIRATAPSFTENGVQKLSLTIGDEYGSFAGRCRLHVRGVRRIGLRVRCVDTFASGSFADFKLGVYGTFAATPALPQIFLPVAETIIVGTAGASASLTYTLAATGSLAPPTKTISSYAWRVWTPNGDTVEGTGSSLATTDWTAYGAGEYVARLIVLYSDSSKGAAEHRFTLPNP